MPSALLDNPHDIGNAPSKLPAWGQWGMVALFAAGLVVAGAFALTEHWRRATFTLGASLVWLTLMRLTCDSKVIGLVAVRSKRFDAIFTAALGSAMMWLAWSVDALGS